MHIKNVNSTKFLFKIHRDLICKKSLFQLKSRFAAASVPKFWTPNRVIVARSSTARCDLNLWQLLRVMILLHLNELFKRDATGGEIHSALSYRLRPFKYFFMEDYVKLFASFF
jgi:hypothetical protein